MIVEMKKIDVLLYHREQAEFLDALGRAGVVDITESYEEFSPKAEELHSTIADINKVIYELKKYPKLDKSSDLKGADLLRNAKKLFSVLEDHKSKMAVIKKEIEQLQPWGDFEPSLYTQLEEQGIYSKFYEVPKNKLALLDKFTYEVISSTKGTDFVVAVSKDKQPVIDGLETIALPNSSLSTLKKREDDLEILIKEVERELSEITASIPTLETYKKELEEELEFEKARISMKGMVANKVLQISGWTPIDNVKTVEDVLNKFNCWYEFSSPTTEDSVPVKMKNKPGFRLFENITTIFSLPDYFEIDPTPFFAPFYALFFGLCLGDLGYGAILFTLALVGYFKTKGTVQQVMLLGTVLGVATMFSGILLNTVFGEEIVKGGGKFTVLAATADGDFPAMSFSVYLGIVQIMLGMALHGVNNLRSSGWKYALYPLGTIFLVIATSLALINIDFLSTATMWEEITHGAIQASSIIGQIPSTVINVFAIVGVLLVLLFNNPAKPFYAQLFPGGFGALYNFATGLMGDSLSYIRLFALGLAGGLLGNAFNQIAFMVSANNKALFIFTIIILILGHTINFGLAALGSFVHPLRLTFVEFYKNLDFKGGARGFKPLTKTEK